jgi:peptide deformylase
MHFEVPRYRSVRVRGHKLMVNKDEVSVGFMEIDELYDGMRAIVCQHEIDHANGILISQVGRQIHIHRS